MIYTHTHTLTQTNRLTHKFTKAYLGYYQFQCFKSSLSIFVASHGPHPSNHLGRKWRNDDDPWRHQAVEQGDVSHEACDVEKDEEQQGS